eukprot:3272678-Prymnesium_polylepis.2
MCARGIGPAESAVTRQRAGMQYFLLGARSCLLCRSVVRAAAARRPHRCARVLTAPMRESARNDVCMCI